MKNVKSFRLVACILAAFIILLTGIESAPAATINVTANATDTLNGADSQCSLREAITNINDGTETFGDCIATGAYGTSDTINIPAGTYTTTSTEYSIAKNVSIVGSGAGTTTINGNSVARVFNVGAYTVSISGVTITGGTVANYGAGIFNGGTLTVTNSTISGNTSSFEGGGIYTATSSILNIFNSTISGNNALKAAGIFNWLGTATVTNSTISGNSAGTGGGIANMNGGGVAHSLTVTNSTISGNSASNGGGIYNQVTADLSNTIVANQTGGADCAGAITSSGHNLESGTSCGFTGTGDLQNTNPLLGALASNGGLTQTMALQPGSPAIDAGDNAICAAAPVNGVDQRSYSRPAGATCDIGAYELAASCVTPPRFGLDAWWSGENNANDSVGTNTGTPINGVTYSAGHVGNAFNMNGIDQAIAVPDGIVPQTARNFTVGAWVNANSSAGSHFIFYGGANVGEYYLYMADGNFGFAVHLSSGGQSVTSPIPSSTGTWYYVAGVRRGTSLEIWVNGALMASTSIPDENLLNASWNPGAFPSRIGAYHHDERGDESRWSGLIDEITLYNRALSASELAWTYRGTCEPNDTVPDAFSFTAQTGAALSSVATSNTITVAGINSAADITIVGGSYAINVGSGGAYTSAAGTVSNGDTVTVRQTSSASLSTTTNAVLTIGGVSGTFSVTTVARKGDLNNDEAVTLVDAILALQTIGGMTPFGIRNNYASSGADVNGDNRIGLEEAIYILQRSAGLRQADTIAVSFDSQGATVAASPSSMTVISPAMNVGTLPAAPTKTGNNFAGWYTGINGTGTEFTAGTVVTADITVYAKWTSDGSNWTARTLPSSAGWRSVTYGNGVFVAVALNNTAATSPDGITWTARTLPSSANWISVTYGNGVFVAVANDSSAAATSPNGITWTARTLPSIADWISVTYGNGIFVAVAFGPGGYPGTKAATSSDGGITWTAQTLPSSAVWYSVTYDGNGHFVAIAQSGTAAATSPDGITWTAGTLPSTETWLSVTYGNGVFVAVAYGTAAATSPDGITWTARTLPISANWYSVTYGDGVFVAVAYGGTTAATSPDGITWTARTLPISANWNSVTYGNGVFVAVATDSTAVATSP